FDYSRGFRVTYEYLMDEVEIWIQGQKRLGYELVYLSDDTQVRSDLKQFTVRSAGVLPEVSQQVVFSYYAPEDAYVGGVFHERDLLKSVQFHQGGVVSYEYTPATHLLDNGGQVLNHRPHYPVFVVSSVIRSDFTGRNDVTNYSYSDGHFFFDGPFDRSFAGFGQVMVTDPLGQQSKYFFHQGGGFAGSSLGEHVSDDWYLLGRMYRSEQYDSSQNLLQRQVISWDLVSLGPQRFFLQATDLVSTLFGSGGPRSSASST
ncbi:unnamed protein product, partial [marine sediment metagenome]